MKKLLLVNHSSALQGGANDDFIRIIRHLRSRNGKYSIYGLFPEGPNAVNYADLCDEWSTYSAGFAPISGLNLLHYYGYFKMLLRQRKEINTLLSKNHFDLCLVNVLVLPGISYMLSERNKVIQMIREFVLPDFIRKMYYHLLSTRVSHFIAVSGSIERDYREISGKNNISTLYSTSEIHEAEEDEKEQFIKEFRKFVPDDFKSGGLFVFVQVGSINENKNQLLTLKSVLEIKKSGIRHMPLFFFAGGPLNGEYGSQLATFIDENELGNSCFLLGERSKSFIHNLLEASDCLIITSKTEGMPLVVSEAMQHSLPIISTRAGGVEDLVKHNFNGIIVEHEKKQLTEAIVRVVENPHTAKELGQNGRRTYFEKLSLQRNLEDLERIVDGIIGD